MVRLSEARATPDGSPVVELAWGDLHRSGYHYGMTHLHHLYTARNYLAVATLWSLIDGYDDDVQDALRLLVLSFNATHSTLMTRVVVKQNSKDFIVTYDPSVALHTAVVAATIALYDKLSAANLPAELRAPYPGNLAARRRKVRRLLQTFTPEWAEYVAATTAIFQTTIIILAAGRSHWFGLKYAIRLTTGHEDSYADPVRGSEPRGRRAIGARIYPSTSRLATPISKNANRS
jgi:hypothetical protein